MKNTFRLGLKYGCVLCKLISSTNGLKICNKSHFFRLGFKLYGLYIFVLHNLLTFFFFWLLSDSVIFQVSNNHSN